MKNFRLMMLAALAVLATVFSACNNKKGEDVKIPESNGSTNMALSLQLPKNNFRENKGTYEGIEKISTIDVYLIDETDGSLSQKTFTEADYEAPVSGLVKPKESAVFKTSPGAKQVYVLVNADPSVKSEVESAISATLLSNVKTKAVELQTNLEAIAKKLAGDDKTNILFTTDLTVVDNGKLTVEDNVSKENVLDPTTPKNLANVTLKRAASIAYLTKSEGIDVIKGTPIINGVKQPEQAIFNVTKFGWSVAQIEKKLYLSPVADPVASPASAYIPADQDEFKATANDHFFYYDLHTLDRDIEDVMATRDAATIGAAAVKAPIFVTENTHDVTSATAASEVFKRGNTTYILVRTIMQPQVWADGKTYAAPKDPKGFDYRPEPIKRPIAPGVGASPEEITFYEQELFDAFANASYEVDGSFYVGDVDQGIYPTYEAMYKAKGGQDGTLYRGGKVLYYVYLNPTESAKGSIYNTLRNDIYHANISEIKKLGFNYNPMYPEPDPESPDNPDPNPDPDGPTPTPTPEQPIDPVETYMAVQINVVPWTVHSYDVIL